MPVPVSSTDVPQEEREALIERLKSALHLPIGTLVDGETLNLGINATPQFIGALTELTYGQIENIAQDLEAFAKHRKGKGDGKRRIEVGDVLLLGRRNEGLMGILEKEAQKVEGKARTTAAKSKGKDVNGAVKQAGGTSNGRSPASTSKARPKLKGKARAPRILDDSALEDDEGEDLEDAEDDDEMNRADGEEDDDHEMADFIVDDE